MPNETEAGFTRNLYRGSAIYVESCIIPDIEISAEVKRCSQVAATFSALLGMQTAGNKPSTTGRNILLRY